MPTPVLSLESIRRVERLDAAFQLSRMEAARQTWPEQGVEIRTFGPLTAIRATGEFLRHKCLVLGLTAVTAPGLGEALAWFREAGRGCALTLPPDDLGDATFDTLVGLGLRCVATAQAMARVPAPWEPASGIVVRPSPPEERAAYLDLYGRGFATEFHATDEIRRWQWLNDGLPGARRFVAEIDGHPVGMASMVAFEGVAYLTTCGVLPEFRRRGVQGALIRARVGAAFDAGCVLIVGGGHLFGAPLRNYARQGFELLPLGTVWTLSP